MDRRGGIESLKSIDEDAVEKSYLASLSAATEENRSWSHWWQHKVSGVVLDHTPGFGVDDRGKGKLVSYNPEALLKRFCGPFVCTNPGLTVWGNPLSNGKIARQTIMVGLICFASALGWPSYDKYTGVIYTCLDDFVHFMLSLCTYLIAGFVALCVNQWYKRRLYYIALLGNLKCFIVIMNGILAAPAHKGWEQAGPAHEEMKVDAATARATLSRYAVLVLELAILKQRGHQDSPEGRAWLETEGCVDARKAEWERMVPGTRHLTVLSWMVTVLRQCFDKGLLRELHTLLDLVEKARSNSSDMMDRTLYDMPFAYHHLVVVIVKVLIYSVAILMGAIASGSQDATSTGGNIPLEQPRRRAGTAFFASVISMIISLAFQGLLDISCVLHNPFGHKDNDIPHEALSAGLRAFADGLRDCSDDYVVALDGSWTRTGPQREGGGGPELV